MVKIAREKTGPNSIRALNRPTAVDVEENQHHMPISVKLRGRSLKVMATEDIWEVVDEWWRTTPIARRYFKVGMEDGICRTIFRDLLSDLWYEQRE